jgi:hypothetical protein
MLRLPFRFPLLRAQTLKRQDDAREFFLERERRIENLVSIDIVKVQT